MTICKECHQEYQGLEYRRHLHGKNHPKYGVKLKQEFRDRISEVHKGKIISEEHKLAISRHNIGKKHSKETRHKMSKAVRHNWKNGVYDNVYTGYGKVGFREDIGHFVRSTWEANIARLLQAMEIEYEYEKYRFDTPNGLYIPDFYLSEDNYYVEVKGYDSDIAKRKRKYVRKKYGIKLIVIAHKRYDRLMEEYKDIDLYPMFEFENVT